MKTTAAVLLPALFIALALNGCTTRTARALNPCPDPRPEVCTREYRPVCGYAAGMRMGTTYGNDCEACADPSVEGWLPGACPE